MLMKNLALLAFAAIAAGCGGGNSTGPGDAGTSCDAAGYACGATGATVGKVIPNLTITGTQRDDNKSGSPVDDPVRSLSLDEYYKDKSIKVLAILVAAEWCIPCQNEQPGLVKAFKDYQAAKKGVAMLEAITQKANSMPADAATTANWANHYNVPFDITFDGTMALAPYSDPTTFPSQMVIRTSDMTIRWMHNGLDDPTALEREIDAVLAQ